MRQQWAGRLRSWLRDRRSSLAFSFLGVFSSVVGVYLIYTARHPVNGDQGRTIVVALAFAFLGETFLIGTLATAPIQLPVSRTSVQGSNIYLPRITAWAILVPIFAECGFLWFALHNDLDRATVFMIVAVALNGIGLLAAVVFRAQLASSSPHTS